MVLTSPPLPRQNHLVAAMRGLDLSGVAMRGQADRRLAQSVEDEGVRAFLLQSLDMKAVPPPRWRNLDLLEAEMARITGWPETEGRFDGPALFLSGSLSDYVRPEHRDKIKALFPRAKFARIPGADRLHAERPREFRSRRPRLPRLVGGAFHPSMTLVRSTNWWYSTATTCSPIEQQQKRLAGLMQFRPALRCRRTRPGPRSPPWPAAAGS